MIHHNTPPIRIYSDARIAVGGHDEHLKKMSNESNTIRRFKERKRKKKERDRERERKKERKKERERERKKERKRERERERERERDRKKERKKERKRSFGKTDGRLCLHVMRGDTLLPCSWDFCYPSLKT